MATNNVMPNFFIIGAAKAGTTTLYELLKQHPDIFLSVIKEPQFFCREDQFEKGIDYYLDTCFRCSENSAARGEATPHYLYFEKVAKRIAASIPLDNQRFIVLLRDPVKRAYSLYWNMVAEGVESLSFTDAINQEKQRSTDPELADKCSLKYQYVRSGMYAAQIRTYYKYFHEKQFLFLFFEDLIQDEQVVLQQVLRFLGVKTDVPISCGNVHNPSGIPRLRFVHEFVRKPLWIKSQLARLLPRTARYRITSKIVELNKKKQSYEPMEKNLELRLRAIFSDDILDLQEITNRDLSSWLRPK